MLIENLKAGIGEKEILKGINMKIGKREIHFLIGPNGSGKTTLANVIAGNPHFWAKGKIIFEGRNILKLEPWERARLGIFIGFQHPPDIPGIKIKDLKANLKAVGFEMSFADRELVGLSGGEKKKIEVAQLLSRDPKLVILDEPDSGVDIDSLNLIGNALRKFYQAKKPEMLIITHRAYISKYIIPHKVHIMMDGKIVCRGDKKLLEELENVGFGGVISGYRCD